MRLSEMTLMKWALLAFATEPYPDTRFPPSPYYRFLRVLAGNLRPRLSVELGCGCAGASLGLAMGHREGTVVGVDKVNEYPDQVAHVLEKFPNFRFLRGDSVELAPRVRREHGETDILFIDTVHTYERTWLEFEAWRPHLSDGAVVCLDDLFRPGMAQAWEELPGRKLRIDELHSGGEVVEGVGDGGFGVIWEL